jgi:hypothetical protein
MYDVYRTLKDCPGCENEKARLNLAHNLFSARPHDAPRTRYVMDFQGQGEALSGEKEALAIMDATTARYVTVLPLKEGSYHVCTAIFRCNSFQIWAS